ncbi:MAG: hypothetical protein EGR26_07120 [Clostridiales bacterium]|jgi:protein arginine kinase activator|nr:hypothetical protein [Clostridiales bacterium]
MRCDRCGKNEATFYYKSNINGKVTQVHLCHQCAEELGYTDSFRSAGMTGGLFGDFFSRPFGMLEPFFSGLGSRMLTEFPEPVDVLGQARESTPAQEDTGDLLPRDEQDALTRQRKRNALQTQLNLAVQEERFEEAAKLRDELKALEK